MVFTEHTLKTGITSVITKQCIVFIFKFSCRSSDFLGSSAIEYFEGEGLRDGGTWWAFGLHTKELQVGHMSSQSARRECGSSAEAWQNQVGSRGCPQCVGSVSPAREGIFQRRVDKFYLGLCAPSSAKPRGSPRRNCPAFRSHKKTQAQARYESPGPCRSALQTLTHNLGKSEDPGAADPA